MSQLFKPAQRELLLNAHHQLADVARKAVLCANGSEKRVPAVLITSAESAFATTPCRDPNGTYGNFRRIEEGTVKGSEASSSTSHTNAIADV